MATITIAISRHRATSVVEFVGLIPVVPSFLRNCLKTSMTSKLFVNAKNCSRKASSCSINILAKAWNISSRRTSWRMNLKKWLNSFTPIKICSIKRWSVIVSEKEIPITNRLCTHTSINWISPRWNFLLPCGNSSQVFAYLAKLRRSIDWWRNSLRDSVNVI